MKLFENEQTQIGKIYNVDKYVNSNPSAKEYGNNFRVCELIYFISGKSKTLIDGVTINDCPGSVRYIPKGQTSGPYRVKPLDVPSACIDVYFDVLSPMPAHPLALYDCKELKDKFLRLYTLWQRKDTSYYAESMKIFYDIISSIQRMESGYLSTEQKLYMQKAHDYILQHYRAQHFDYKALCDSVGLKYSHFSTLFDKTFGMSPVRFVTKMKIDYAKELLVTNRFSVSEIAEMCGFENVYYFSAVFKKQTGFSPTKYVREIENI